MDIAAPVSVGAICASAAFTRSSLPAPLGAPSAYAIARCMQ